MTTITDANIEQTAFDCQLELEQRGYMLLSGLAS